MADAPKRLDHFVLVERIGAGGMGEVYRATDTDLSREVAIKVLPPDFTDDEERRERFLREARAAAGLRHANVVVVHAVGESEGTAYIAMELVAGCTVADEIAKKSQLEAEEARGIAESVASALAAAHEKGLVHRDIKPANVMLGDDGTVKVLDFGLAAWRAADEEAALDGDASEDDATATATPQTEEGRVLGTPGYMSPEQALGRRAGVEADVFALGILLYEMLHGRLPFEGTTTAERLVATARDDPRPVAQRVPADLAALISDCLAKEPADRPTAQVCVERLVERFAPPPSGIASNTLKRWPLLVAAGVATAAIAVWQWPGATQDAVSPAASTAPSASSSATATGARMVDLPIVGNPKPDAVAAYKKGLQAWRDASWGAARLHFDEAVKLDPGFAQAWLRKAQADVYRGPLRLQTGRKLATMREQLQGRDRDLFEALRPLILLASPDAGAFAQKICALADRRSGDAELQCTCAAYLRGDDPERSIAYARRAVALDADYADAWQVIGEASKFLDRTQDATKALARCIDSSPIAIDCRKVRAGLNAAAGRCREVEQDGQEICALTTKGNGNDASYAQAMAALDKPPDKVRATLRKCWSAELDVLDVPLARFDVWQGRFDEAESRLRTVLANEELLYRYRGRAAVVLAELLIETNRKDDAGAVARKSLDDRPSGQRMLTRWSDPLPTLWAIRRAVDDTVAAAARNAIDAWQKSRSKSRGPSWVFGELRLVHDAESASAALAEGHAEEIERALGSAENLQVTWLLANVYRLAGDAVRAAELYERAARHCGTFQSPFAHVRASYWLGRLREDDGDKKGACNAYQRVLDRWGQAKPASVTAKKAKARRVALGCE